MSKGMGTSMRVWCAVGALVVFGLTQQAALGSYVLTSKLSVTGASSTTVAPGGTAAIDFILQSSGSDVHTSAIFQVKFSAPGLTETTYLWTSPYTTGTANDDSTPYIFPNTSAKPGRPQTPTTITQSTFVSGTNPTDIDIEFSNVLDAGTFGSGNLVTMGLQVPANWSGPSAVAITAIPDQFANGFTIIPTTAGPNFTLNIATPEPGSLSLSGFALGAVLLRRRGRRASVQSC